MPRAATTSRKELDPQLRSRLCELSAIGWSYSKIRERYPHIPLSTIKTTILREELRVNNMSRPRPGAPRKMSPEHRARVVALLERDPSTKLADLLAAVDYVVQKRSMQRFILEIGGRSVGKGAELKLKPEEGAGGLEKVPATAGEGSGT